MARQFIFRRLDDKWVQNFMLDMVTDPDGALPYLEPLG